MNADLNYLDIGVALAVAVVVPNTLWRIPFLSTPIVLVGFAALVGLLPQFNDLPSWPQQQPVLTVTGFTSHGRVMSCSRPRRSTRTSGTPTPSVPRRRV